jgi:hypothetical protein
MANEGIAPLLRVSATEVNGQTELDPFYGKEGASDIHFIGGWVYARTCLDTVEKIRMRYDAYIHIRAQVALCRLEAYTVVHNFGWLAGKVWK